MSLVKGDYPDRDAAAVALTAELLRIGMDTDEIEARLNDWNRFNSPPLKPDEIQRAIENGSAGKYDYSCEHSILAYFCIGSDCPVDKRKKLKDRKVQNFRFLDYGWQQVLSNRQVLIYYAALPYLEVKRRAGPGGMIYASHVQLAKTCGISYRRMGDDLQVLADLGLITYKPGLPQVWKHQASEVRRIIPIPRLHHPAGRKTRNHG
jgi:hypothetical protein